MKRHAYLLLIVAALVLPACEPPTKPVVTQIEYEFIHPGMSYEEVAKVIGSEGTEMSSSAFPGTYTVMYTWSNGDGSNMNAVFQNDKLVTKAQYGLK